MNVISNELKALVESGKPVTSIFFTAGFPHVDSTLPILAMLEEEGVDMVEVGFPFSDPVADGEVIQQSNNVAIENGMTLKRLLAELKQRKFNIPIVLMGYINPVIQYGFENFLKDAREAGVSGLILPDLPYDWATGREGKMIGEAGLSLIPLIAPTSEAGRIQDFDRDCSSFIYAVSSNSVTGGQVDVASAQSAYLGKLKDMRLSHGVLVGFGINSKERLQAVQEKARGGIIGTAFIKSLQGSDYLESGRSFIRSLRR